LSQKADIWLFDCGEGTQHQLLKSDLRVSQIRRIFISHMHGDHLYGLPGLLASIGLAGTSKGVEIFGPDSLESYLRGVFQTSSCRIRFPIKIYSIAEESKNKKHLFEDETHIVTVASLKHRVPAYAFRVQEKPKPGKFNLELAKKLQIPPGPIYASLQKGLNVEFNGSILKGENFCGPPREGASMVYCTDTVFCDSAVKLAKGADLLIHESTYSHFDSKLAFERMHSTSTMAAQAASEAGVGQLVLTHLSPRYAPGNSLTLKDLLVEAKAIFPNTTLANDFLRIKIKTRCNSS